jgi:hypothetical protein
MKTAWRIAVYAVLGAVLCIVLGVLQGCFLLIGPDGLFAKKCTLKQVDAPPVATAVVHAEWVKRFGELPKGCREMPFLWVVRKTIDDYHQNCPEHSAGCQKFYEECPAAITYEPYRTDKGLYVHEYAHFALACQGKGSDPGHTLPEVWQAGGIVEFFRAQNVKP